MPPPYMKYHLKRGATIMVTEYESRGYLLDDFRLFHLNDAQGTKVDYHYHEFCKLLLLRSGGGGYMVNGQRYTLEPGDMVLVGSHTIHRPEFQPGVPYERIILYIRPEFLQQHSFPDCDLGGVFSGVGGHILRPGKQRQQLYAALCNRLEQELAGKGYGHQVLSTALLLQLLGEISRDLNSPEAELPQPHTSENSRILDILRYIDGHLADDLTIDALSEQFYISKFHMMRLFRQEVGQTIHNYLCDRRLIHARDLINQGLSATESCFRSGFRSYSSFTRAYGKRFGTTPTGRSAQMEDTFDE